MEEEKKTPAAEWAETPAPKRRKSSTRKPPAKGTAAAPKKKTAPKAKKPAAKKAEKPAKAAPVAEKPLETETTPPVKAEAAAEKPVEAAVETAPVNPAEAAAEPAAPAPETAKAEAPAAAEPPAAPETGPETPDVPDTAAETPTSPEPAEQAEAPAETAQTDAEPAEAPAAAAPAESTDTADSAPEPSAAAPPAEPAATPAHDPAELDEYAFDEEEDTPAKRERAANISRTAQLSIAQIMAELDEKAAAEQPPEPPTPPPPADTGADADDTDDEPSDTIPRILGRGAFGIFKWLLLVVLFIAVIAGGGVAWLYRSATPDLLPELSATFDGQTLSPTAYSWHVPVVGHIFKRTYAETLSSAPYELEDSVSGASPDIVVTPSSGYTTALTITNAENESVYEGSVTGFRSYLFAENGTYDAKLVVTAAKDADDTAGITGSETWQFRFTINIRPTIQLATEKVTQGSVAAVRVGPTLGDSAPAIRTTMETTGFVKAANGWICYLPIPWNEQTGDKTVTVTVDGYSEDLTFTVRAASYTYKDYSSKSQMTSPYIGEGDAPAAVQKLLTGDAGAIQWAVGGFVQPFLDTFSTPLTYGMTEYAGRAYSERSTNYGYGGRTSTNVVIKPKKSGGSMIVPATGKVLLAEDLGGIYGNTVVIDHGAGLRSIFYGLGDLNVKAGENVKQGQLLGTSGKTVVAELRLGTVPIDPLAVWRSQCDGLKNY